MAFPSVTNVFVTNNVLTAAQMNTNFTDLINGITDGTKDLRVNVLTTTSNLIANGNTTLGVDATKTISIMASLTSHLIPITTASSQLTIFRALYLDGGAGDGGTIYFDSGTTNYIQSSNDGLILTIAGWSSGVRLNTTSAYLRLGAGEDLEIKENSSNFEIRNRTSNKDLSLFINKDGADTEVAKVDGSEGFVCLKSYSEEPMQNLIINGDFKIWQRGNTFTAAADQQVTADRWIYKQNGAVVQDVFRSTDFPDGFNGLTNSTITDGLYSIHLDCTTADASIASSDRATIQQMIEGYDYAPLEGKKGTLGFYVKSTKTGTFSVAFRNLGAANESNRSYVGEYVVSASDTWEYKTMTVNFNYTGGTWNYTNGQGLSVTWALAAGTSFTTASINTWVNTNVFASTAQTNAVDSTSNNFKLAFVNMNIGPIAMPFQPKLHNDTLVSCERYYEKSYDYTVKSGTSNSTNGAWAMSKTLVSATSMGFVPINFETQKRITPTVINFSTENGTAGVFYSEFTADDVTTSIVGANDMRFNASASNAVLNQGYRAQAQFTADAEIPAAGNL